MAIVYPHLHTLNSFLVGPASNFGTMTRPGQGFYDRPSSTSGEYQSVDDYLADGVVYLPALKGICLQPANASPYVDMDLAGFPGYNTSHWRTCTALDAVHLYSFNNVADTATSITSDYNLRADPWPNISFWREAYPPEGQDWATQIWAVDFGDGYTLEWSRSPQTPARLLLDGIEISRIPAKGVNPDTFAVSPVLQWRLAVFLGTLYIDCTGFSQPWEVALTGSIPAAPFTVRGYGGAYWINVSEQQFAASGSYEYTINTGWDYGADPDSLAALPADADVSTAISRSGTDVTVTVTLTRRADGSSPVVQATYPEYDETWIAPTDSWTNITAWYAVGRESISQDIGSRSLTLELRRYQNEVDLLTYAGALDSELAFKYSVGARYRKVGGGTQDVTYDRMVGLLQGRAKKTCTGKTPTVSLRAVDRWKQLEKVVFDNPPYLGGLGAGDAIAKLARWAGVYPDQIDLAAGVNDFVLTEPGGYDVPVWLPTPGETAAQGITNIAAAFGLLVFFGANGWLFVRLGRSETIQASYTMEPGQGHSVALSDVEEDSDISDAVNCLVAIGEGPDGRPLRAVRYDTDALTPGNPRYRPYIVREELHVPECHSEELLDDALDKAWPERRAGWPRVSITSATADLWGRWPDTYIEVTESTVLVTEVVSELMLAKNTTTVTGELRG